MRRSSLRIVFPSALVALVAASARGDEWTERAATNARVEGQLVAALSTSGFTLGGKKREWREDPALSLAVLRATARPAAKRSDLLAALRFALEERLWTDARSLADELGVPLDVATIDEAATFHASGSFEKGVLDVPLGARDFAATSYVGPLVERLLPESILGVALERPARASLVAREGALVLSGSWPRAFGREVAAKPRSTIVLEHEGLPSANAYFGFDLLSGETPTFALYAFGREGGSKIDLKLVSGTGTVYDDATTPSLRAGARLRLEAGVVCRLLADGKEVARVRADRLFDLAAGQRVRPVLAVTAGDAPRADARFGALRLAFAPDPAWLERATARARSTIARALGVARDAFRAETAHFAIETDLGPVSLAGVAADIEAAFAGYEKRMGAAPARAKVSVKVFGVADDYRAASLAAGERFLTAFYDDATRTISLTTEDREDRRAVLAHEAFHAYAADALPELPTWLAEGLAMREEFRFVGRVPRSERRALARALARPHDWVALVTSDVGEFRDAAVRDRVGHRTERERRNYTLSWALCELAERKPESAAGRLVARALEAAKKLAAIAPSEVDAEALDAEAASLIAPSK